MEKNAEAHVSALVEALEQIVKQYPNPAISHVDYRVHARKQAEHALAEYRANTAAERPLSAVSDGICEKAGLMSCEWCAGAGHDIDGAKCTHCTLELVPNVSTPIEALALLKRANRYVGVHASIGGQKLGAEITEFIASHRA